MARSYALAGWVARSTHWPLLKKLAASLVGHDAVYRPVTVRLYGSCLRSRPPDPSPSSSDGGGLGGRSTIDILIGKPSFGSSLNIPEERQVDGAPRSTTGAATLPHVYPGEVAGQARTAASKSQPALAQPPSPPLSAHPFPGLELWRVSVCSWANTPSAPAL